MWKAAHDEAEVIEVRTPEELAFPAISARGRASPGVDYRDSSSRRRHRPDRDLRSRPGRRPACCMRRCIPRRHPRRRSSTTPRLKSEAGCCVHPLRRIPPCERSPSLRAAQQPAAREDRSRHHADGELAIALGVGHLEHPVRAVTLDRRRRDVARGAIHRERVGPKGNVLAKPGDLPETPENRVRARLLVRALLTVVQPVREAQAIVLTHEREADLRDPACVSRTWPDYFEMLARL